MTPRRRELMVFTGVLMVAGRHRMLPGTFSDSVGVLVFMGASARVTGVFNLGIS